MNRTALGILAATCALGGLGAVGAALAAPAADPLAGYYGNAILTMNQPLYVIRTWYYPDHNFKQFKASHETGNLLLAGFEGKWEMQGNNVCLTYDKIVTQRSLEPPTPGCQPVAAHKLGDVWKVTLKEGPYKGTTETSTVIEGHNTAP